MKQEGMINLNPQKNPVKGTVDKHAGAYPRLLIMQSAGILRSMIINAGLAG